MNIFLGVDPGLDGALAFFDPKANELEVFDMPTHEVRVNNKNKRTIDVHELGNIVRKRAVGVRQGIIEKVSALPKQGVTSSFNFGFNTGCTHMVLAAFNVPYILVAPMVWKKDMNVGANKVEARHRASQLLPKHSYIWPLKKHDGRAEASLLAYYASRKFNIEMEDLL